MSELNLFQILEYSAWAISAVLGLYMLVDLLKTNSAYSDDVLISSKEGEIEDALVNDPSHQGGHR